MTIHGRRPSRGRAHARLVLASVAAGLLTSACGPSTGPAPAQKTPVTAVTPSTTPPQPTPSDPIASSPSPTPSASPPPLAGRTVGIDPGHNGRNFADPAYIDSQIWNGRESENCDTTGTETDGGYTEALFNFQVASFLRADLLRDGANVVMTRSSDDGAGPCVTSRAKIINDSRANVAVDIHADGGPVTGRGFAILEPVADGPNDGVITSSGQFGADVRQALLSGTSMPESTYDGVNGITQRDDLAGLNLTTVPKVLIECGNMRNATDAALLTSAAFQEQVARALEAAIIRFLS